jgi:hypothetical protein
MQFGKVSSSNLSCAMGCASLGYKIIRLVYRKTQAHYRYKEDMQVSLIFFVAFRLHYFRRNSLLDGYQLADPQLRPSKPMDDHITWRYLLFVALSRINLVILFVSVSLEICVIVPK